jgi:hypothetical protein
MDSYDFMMRGHVAPIVYLTTDLTITKIFMNNYTAYLKEKMNTKAMKDLLYNSYEKLKSIKNDITKDTIKSSMKQFTTELLKLTFNIDVIKAGINITIARDLEYNDDPVLAEILNNVQNDPDITNLFDATLLYPDSHNITRIDWIGYYKIVMEMNNRYSPAFTKTEIAANFKETFIDFCKNHDINYDELI